MLTIFAFVGKSSKQLEIAITARNPVKSGYAI